MEGHVGANSEATPVRRPPEPLDFERALPQQMTLGEVFSTCREDVRGKRCTVDLAISDDPVVSDQLHEDEVLAAEVGWRVAYYEGLDLSDLHCKQATSRIASRLQAFGQAPGDLSEVGGNRTDRESSPFCTNGSLGCRGVQTRMPSMTSGSFDNRVKGFPHDLSLGVGPVEDRHHI